MAAQVAVPRNRQLLQYLRLLQNLPTAGNPQTLQRLIEPHFIQPAANHFRFHSRRLDLNLTLERSPESLDDLLPVEENNAVDEFEAAEFFEQFSGRRIAQAATPE